MASIVDGILGQFNRNGEPVKQSIFQCMAEQVCHRSNGWDAVVSSEEVIFSYAYAMGENRFVCSFHGVLYNEPELHKRCDVPPQQSSCTAKLLISLYQKYGTGFPALLEGDFALIIWDKHERNLFCARDISGFKPFYYYIDHKVFLWASELKPLIKHPLVLVAPNEHCVAQHLLDSFSSTQDTLYKNVLRLPPGHSLIVNRGGYRLEKYWYPEAIEELKYPTDKEYSDHLHHLIKVSVRKCREGYSHPGVMLSGGVDSSALFGVVAAQNQACCNDAQLTALSNVFPGVACDESDYIHAVLKKWPSPHVFETAEAQKVETCLQQAAYYGSIPDYPNGAMSNVLLHKAKQAGIDPLLTGLGGDEWFSGNLYHFADYLFSFKLGKYVREARKLPSEKIWKKGRDSLLYYSLNPHIPQWLKKVFRPNIQRSNLPSWIAPEMVQHHYERKPWEQMDHSSFGSSRSKQIGFMAATSPFGIYSREMEERSAAWYGVEFRHPLFTKTIIEFALSLPLEQLCRGFVLKYALRESMKPYLPEAIYARQTKTNYESVIAHSVFSCKQLLHESMHIADRVGWVDGKKVRDIAYALDKSYYTNKRYSYSKALWLLWSCIAVECWYRENF